MEHDDDAATNQAANLAVWAEAGWVLHLATAENALLGGGDYTTVLLLIL